MVWLVVPVFAAQTASNTAVVIRFARSVKLDLIAAYASSLLPYDLWILFDNSVDRIPNERLFHHSIGVVARRGARVAVLDEDDFRREYTANFSYVLKGRPAGRVLHAPFVNLWRHTYNLTYEYYWVLEDDARLTGDDYPAFFAKYDTVEADLVAGQFDSLRGNQFFDWPVPLELLSKAREHVQRYSRHLLDELHVLHKLGVAAHGEFFAATVCSTDPACEIHWMEPDGVIGSRYNWSSQVTPFDWRRLEKEEPGRWFHALKWLGSKYALDKMHLPITKCAELLLCNIDIPTKSYVQLRAYFAEQP